MLILLWGLPDEAPLAAVARALRDASAPFALLDQRQVLATRVQLAVGHRVSGSITLGDLRVDMEEIAAAYIRPYESRLFTSVARARRPAAAQARASSVDELLLSWCDVTPALVLNRPRHMGSNNSKPYQAQIIRKFGFHVPQTLITTSPVAAREFQQQHGSVIYKSISGIRSRVTRLTPAHAERLPDVAFCPTQFQELVPGRDYRAHIVGSDVFASLLHCDADDYRYPGDSSLEIRSTTLPADIEERCIRLARSLELPLAGIDLRRTPSDEWYCFEVNPSPAFTFYQDSTGQPIVSAIASLLMTRIPASESSSLLHPSAHQPVPIAMDESLSLVPASLWKN
jgi:RimK-like ATP-grasp domain